MHVAAILDTILALWKDFSDIVTDRPVSMFEIREWFHVLIIAKRRYEIEV
jgi:hypothetical protein